MKRLYLICIVQLLTATFLLAQSNSVPTAIQIANAAPPISASQPGLKAQSKVVESYGRLPLSFEANQGQTDAQVKFLSRASGYTLFLTGDEAVLTLTGPNRRMSSLDGNTADRPRLVPGNRLSDRAGSQKPDATSGAAHRESTLRNCALRMKLHNANPAAKISGMDELAGTSNYFTGNDPAKWRTNVPTYAKVKYEGIYSGVDLVYYGNQRQLEYDFVVAPGADPRRIAFDVSGAKRIHREAQGDLLFKIGEGEIRWHKPVVYQEKNGTRQEIAARYAITDENRGFQLAKYDVTQPLYIDPLI